MKKLLFLGIFAAFSVSGVHAEEKSKLVMVQEELAYQKLVEMYKNDQMTRKNVELLRQHSDAKDFEKILAERKEILQRGQVSGPVCCAIMLVFPVCGLGRILFDYDAVYAKELIETQKYSANMLKYCTAEEHAKSNVRTLGGVCGVLACLLSCALVKTCKVMYEELKVVNGILEKFDQFNKDAVAERLHVN